MSDRITLKLLNEILEEIKRVARDHDNNIDSLSIRSENGAYCLVIYNYANTRAYKEVSGWYNNKKEFYIFLKGFGVGILWG